MQCGVLEVGADHGNLRAPYPSPLMRPYFLVGGKGVALGSRPNLGSGDLRNKRCGTFCWNLRNVVLLACFVAISRFVAFDLFLSSWFCSFCLHS